MSIDTSRDAIRKAWEGLIEYCTQSGPLHDDECPCDSTCDCGCKWMNDGANAACHLLCALADERDQLRAEVQSERTAREQAEARAAIDQAQCDEMTARAGELAEKFGQAEARVRELRGQR